MGENDSFIENYFDIIQKIIKRMAKNSFSLKAWTLTIIAAVIALTLQNIQWLVFLMLSIIIPFFWALDSYYLKQERKFRSLWRVKVDEFNETNKIDRLYDLDISEILVDKTVKIMRSFSELLFYLPLMIFNISMMIYFIIVVEILKLN